MIKISEEDRRNIKIFPLEKNRFKNLERYSRGEILNYFAVCDEEDEFGLPGKYTLETIPTILFYDMFFYIGLNDTKLIEKNYYAILPIPGVTTPEGLDRALYYFNDFKRQRYNYKIISLSNKHQLVVAHKDHIVNGALKPSVYFRPINVIWDALLSLEKGTDTGMLTKYNDLTLRIKKRGPNYFVTDEEADFKYEHDGDSIIYKGLELNSNDREEDKLMEDDDEHLFSEVEDELIEDYDEEEEEEEENELNYKKVDTKENLSKSKLFLEDDNYWLEKDIDIDNYEKDDEDWTESEDEESKDDIVNIIYSDDNEIIGTIMNTPFKLQKFGRRNDAFRTIIDFPPGSTKSFKKMIRNNLEIWKKDNLNKFI